LKNFRNNKISFEGNNITFIDLLGGCIKYLDTVTGTNRFDMISEFVGAFYKDVLASSLNSEQNLIIMMICLSY
jgi:hypothetical protein